MNSLTAHDYRMEKFISSVIVCRVSEVFRYRVNWLILYVVGILVGATFFITTPSLHQFVTSSKNYSNSNIKIEPGLGLSETWYTLIVCMGSVGEFLGAVLYGISSRHVYVKVALIVELTIEFAGGVFYAVASNGWMLLVSRLLTGIFLGINQSIIRVYLGETSEKLIRALPIEKQAKSTIKYTAFFILFLFGAIGQALGPVITAIVSQIPLLDQFRWPGYYLCVHAFILFVVVLIFFNEKWVDINRIKKKNRKRCQWTIKKPVVPIYLTSTFILSFIVLGWNITIIDTLENPILSDQFGMDIKRTSYIIFGVLGLNSLSIISVYILQKCHVNNRRIVIGGFVIATIGSILASDWQSIGGDPCHQIGRLNFSQEHYDMYSSGSGDYTPTNCTNELSNPICFANSFSIDPTACNSSFTTSCLCEQFSSVPNYQCFWNPISRVTGDYCDRCREVCLSKSHSLNFIQLFIGITAMAIWQPPGRLVVTAIASDLYGENSQGRFMSILVASGAFSRATGPLWSDPLYLAVDHHTWLVMLVIIVGQVTVLTLLVIFYHKMNPKKKSVELTVAGDRVEEDTIELLMEEEFTEQFNEETDL